MIVLLILNVIVTVLQMILHLFPHIDVLPFGIDSVLVQGVGYIHYIASVFPPVQSLLNAFLFCLSFLLLMKFVRLIPWFGRIF